ncbi:PaaI family thioesterase [Paraglaciecola sp.]|uniref:PaaI family thioesterase n=1 Tax=Paraglaciecola sp. TaxID=1920173 RepID=UPI00273F3C89|nr:PaaI family thioesterase [Paraglaciecola sp.]MDP5031784.1 PaaI family thioesterase [Paraglaciecola sp.]
MKSKQITLIAEAVSAGQYQSLLDSIPYINHLGIRVKSPTDNTSALLRFHLPFRTEIIGNPMLPALHGGVIGALMETAGLIQVIVSERQPRLPKIIDFSVDYLRSAQAKDCWATCDVARMGSRVAAISVRCWQESESRPIATARAHLLLVD